MRGTPSETGTNSPHQIPMNSRFLPSPLWLELFPFDVASRTVPAHSGSMTEDLRIANAPCITQSNDLIRPREHEIGLSSGTGPLVSNRAQGLPSVGTLDRIRKITAGRFTFSDAVVDRVPSADLPGTSDLLEMLSGVDAPPPAATPRSVNPVPARAIAPAAAPPVAQLAKVQAVIEGELTEFVAHRSPALPGARRAGRRRGAVLGSAGSGRGGVPRDRRPSQGRPVPAASPRASPRALARFQPSGTTAQSKRLWVSRNLDAPHRRPFLQTLPLRGKNFPWNEASIIFVLWPSCSRARPCPD